MNKFLFLLYSFILTVLLLETPNKINYLMEHPYVFSLAGVIGLYRYSLWTVHFVRAQVYEKYFYRNIRKKSEKLLEKSWKPSRLYFMIASYREDKNILFASIKSILNEARSLDLPVTLCMGTASLQDEKSVCAVLKGIPYGDRVKVTFIRNNVPDKRLQMGSALRAMVRQGVEEKDPVFFMDGDSVIKPGCLKKCLPIFKIRPDIDAVTTNEKAVVINSGILSGIFSLKFAVRNFHMQSLSLSGKVLCLTGRFSIFRGEKVFKEEFISRIENDSIYDRYWGKIQFLSGDDKSTWFSLLKNGSNMLYVPDAYIYSIEKIKNPPFKRYVEDLMRWGGNMLRNNERALLLGPERVGFFPWFILLDQRISMWTAIISPFVIFMTLFYDLKLGYMLFIWILTVKYLQSLILYYYNGGINWTFPLVLYLNQVLNGFVKIYMLFHLGLQHWNNRNILQRPVIRVKKFQLAFAKYLVALYLVIFFLVLNSMAFGNWRIQAASANSLLCFNFNTISS